ncbi:protein of unknown function (plasmid) [Caballeronia sp. S22]
MSCWPLRASVMRCALRLPPASRHPSICTLSPGCIADVSCALMCGGKWTSAPSPVRKPSTSPSGLMRKRDTVACVVTAVPWSASGAGPGPGGGGTGAAPGGGGGGIPAAATGGAGATGGWVWATQPALIASSAVRLIALAMRAVLRRLALVDVDCMIHSFA